MGPASYWARAQRRRQRGASLTIALLIAVACAGPTAAVAGALRTGSVVDRLGSELHAGDVQLQVEELDLDRVDALRAVPGVERVGVRSTIFLRPTGTDLKPFLDFFAVGSADGVAGYDIVRPSVDVGRLPAVDSATEVLVSRKVAELLDLDVGSQVSVDTLTLPTVFASFETGGIPEPDGPTIELDVVGIGRLPVELLSPERIPHGTMFFSPAFLAEHEAVAAFTDVVDVELTEGPGGIDDLVASFPGALGTDEVFVTPVEQELAQVRDGVAVLRTALLLFAAVAGLAAAVVVAQAAARTAARHDDDLVALAALGFETPQRIRAVVWVLLPAVVAGTAMGILLAVVASRWLPFGLARRLEPDPGLHVDGLTLATGAVVTLLGAVVAIAVATTLADRRRRQAAAPTASRAVAAVASHARPATATGVRWAFTAGRGRTATPVRSALVGTAIGLGGTIAALGFGGSLVRLVDTPPRYGVGYDLEVGVVGDESTDQEALAAADELAGRDEVKALSLVRVTKVTVRGETHDAFGLDARRGAIGYSVVEGRAPASDSDVLVGTALLDELDLAIGDELVLEGGTATFTIVGRGAFPPLDDANSLATGLGFTLTGLADVIEDLGPTGTSSGFPQALVDVAPGEDVEALRLAYREEFGFARSATRPTSIANLGEADAVPPLIAGFLAALGLLALGHAVIASASRRRRELALLRAIGFLRRDLAATVRAHAATVALVGLGVGLPLGLVVGRWSWRFVAHGLGVADDPSSLVVPLGLVVPSSILLTLLLAAPSARAAARTRPASALRTE